MMAVGGMSVPLRLQGMQRKDAESGGLNQLHP